LKFFVHHVFRIVDHFHQFHSSQIRCCGSSQLPSPEHIFIPFRPAVDVGVVQILETMQSSRSPSIPQNSPGDNTASGIASIDRSDATLSDEFPWPDDYFDAPEDQIHCVPCLNHDAVETFDQYPAEIPLNV
jgi:hypothetical protein